ncbi:aldose 1-epimerase [Humitalea rosea]|uniref:Aldose 1-epimerase n=1 Tax=Humitalea rosea TaxID=990373 RepID=A0A2W7II92_9PROT|nr:aldose epimerase [Humitalea rosea]PZW46530.1 aldose 1-epimerase [Humitalea rosea]
MSLSLIAGGWTARLLPEYGAAFAALTCDGRDVLKPVPEGAEPLAARAGAFWMAPWTNRLDAGHLGTLHTYPLNRADEGVALHGTLRDLPWRVEHATPDGARLVAEDPTLPLACRARLDVALSEAGLTLRLALTNLGATRLPFGMGWHPWFVRPQGTTLGFQATHRFQRNDRGLPTGNEPATGMDGGEDELEGEDTHWAGWGGLARMDLGGLRLTLAATGAWARNLQVFAAPYQRTLCVEPVSHVPDVVNRRQFAALGDMCWLAPGESMAGSIIIGRG